MARAKKNTSSTEEMLAAAFQARAINGNNQDTAETSASTVGLYLPFLSQRLLFQRTTFPLGRTTIIYGPTGSNKSALVYYFYDLFLDNGGRYFHLDVEDKDTPAMRLALTKYRSALGECRSCDTINVYQIEIESYLNWYVALAAKKDGPGKACPVIIGVDSLVAKMTADAAKKVEGDHGATGRRFADEARALNDWFKYIPGKMTDMPICLLGVNHDKPSKDDKTGATIHRTPGGASPNYNSTYKIYAERVKKLPQTVSGTEGNRIKLEMHKNSLGADGQKIEVEVVWSHKPVKSRSGKQTLRQIMQWSWAKATVEHLYRMQGVDNLKKMGHRGDAVNDLLQIRRHTGGRYSAKMIDVPTSDPISASALGRLIETKTDVLAQLEPELGIHPSYAYRPGVDYDVQVAEAKAAVDDYVPAEPTEGEDVLPDEEPDE